MILNCMDYKAETEFWPHNFPQWALTHISIYLMIGLEKGTKYVEMYLRFCFIQVSNEKKNKKKKKNFFFFFFFFFQIS